MFNDFRDIPLNSRGKNHIREILSYWTPSSEEELLMLKDLLIKGKVLPRIEMKKNLIEQINIMNVLSDYQLSYDKMEKMLSTNYTISFW